MSKGYMGKIMMVDLGAGTIEVEDVDDAVYEQYLSGTGLAARILYDRIPAGADPLGPDNILGFVSGLLTGTGAQFAGRWMAAARSPLTGGWGDSNCGGKFSPAIKACGVDGIFFRGISERPIMLRVIDGAAELVDASHVWGKDALEAEEILAAETGKKNARVAVIGTAGEKLSLISGIVNDGGRIAARSGLGAVMGSKRLKAVVLASRSKIKAYDPAGVKLQNKKFMGWFKRGMGLKKALGRRFIDRLATFMRVSPVALAYTGDLVKVTFSKYGTICTNVLSSESGDSPVKNWKGTGGADFPLGTHSGKLNPEYIIEHEKKKYHCYACPLGCGGIVEFEEGRFSFTEMHKPEYETCCALGTLLVNSDLESIFHVNDMLNRAGMDTISAGATVAFAMECYELGILSRDDLDGIDLRWGDGDAIKALVAKMISREGCGDLLADGVKVASKKIGKGSGEFAMHAGGQEIAMHDSRFDPGFAVAYTCEPTPGRHTNHGYQWAEMFALHRLFKGLPKTPPFYLTKKRYDMSETKNTLLVAASKYMQVVNGCGVCLFGAQMGGNLPVPGYINSATGWNLPAAKYLEIGHRIQSLRQAFNIKHGVEMMKDFKLPRRAIGMPPLGKGPLKGRTLDEDRLQGDWLAGMGWDRTTAAPTRQTLERLGLHDVAEDIHGEG